MYIAALDIGGTKTIVAILDENGGILIQESFPSIVARYDASGIVRTGNETSDASD
ncbi:MAG: hypothetical protein V8R61_08280 [Enterocloster sp.]